MLLYEKRSIIMDEWGRLRCQENLAAWSIQFKSIKRCMGKCLAHRKLIRISEDYLDKNPIELALDTIRHEVAHATNYLRFNMYGHGRTWKSEAIRLGATPRACSVVKTIHPDYLYTATCLCGIVRGKYRIPRRQRYCLKCLQTLQYVKVR